MLTVLLSESTLVSEEGGVIGISGLVTGKPVVDWSLWSQTPPSVVCLSIEGNSPGALEGLEVKSTYVGSSPLSALTFDALADLKGSSKPFFLILVCGGTSFPDSGSGLCSFLADGSVFCPLGRIGSTRGMCRSLRDCLVESSPLTGWDEREVFRGCGGKEIGRLPPDARSASLKMTRGTTGVFSTAILILPTTELK